MTYGTMALTRQPMAFLRCILNRALLIIGLLMCFTWNASAAILLYDDAEDAPNTTSDWLTAGDYGSNDISVSTEQARAGASSYKFVLAPQGTSGTETNIELILRGLSAPKATPLSNFSYGVEYWMGWSVYIPLDTHLLDAETSFVLHGQFHSAPDVCDNAYVNPTAANFFYSSTGGFKTNILAEEDACSDKVNDRFVSYYSGALVKGAWNDIVMNFRFDWDASPGGFFKMWLNGVLYKDISDADMNDIGINCWNDAKGPFFKWGLYANTAYFQTIYTDEFRVGDSSESYETIAPSGSGNPAPDPLTITTASIGTLTQDSTSTGTFAATGGISPYTWSSADKPSWFTLTAATGAWSATPTAGGTYAFTITCTDSDSNTANKVYSGLITETTAPTLPTVTAFVMPDTSTTLEVSVSSLTGSASTAAYIITESPSKPVPADPGWSASQPSSATATDDGEVHFYAYVKDSDGNVSVGDVEVVTITIGSQVVTGWTETGTSNVWSAALTTLTPLVVDFDGTDGTFVSVLEDVAAAGDWYFASDVIYTYSESDPDSAYTTITAYTDAEPTPITPTEAVLRVGGDKSVEIGGERTVKIR